MKTPPLLLGAALLFWGWQTGHLALSAALAAALELSRIIKTRWDFSDDEFNQLWNLCVLLFVGVAVYALAANEGATAVSGFFAAKTFGERSNALNKGAQAVQVFIQWLPLVFFPFMAAQAYSQREEADLSTFSLWLRLKKRREEKAGGQRAPGRGVNAAYPYLAVCLAAVCAVKTDSAWFYPGLCLVLAWGLWPRRNRRFPPPAWAAAVLVAAGLGQAGIQGLQSFQAVVENFHTDWVSRFARRAADPKESRTALGHIGRIKLSGRIVLRLELLDGQTPPPLLRESSYYAYRAPAWMGATRTFAPLIPETNDTTWVLVRNAQPTGSLRIAGYLQSLQGVLPLPAATVRLDDLNAAEVETNHLGTVRVKEGPGLVSYAARYGAAATIDGPAENEDLEVPATERPALAAIAAELRLPAPTPAETLRRVSRFFQDKFEYQLLLTNDTDGASNQTALSRFLLRQRAGHCEYFATATTLLLRQAGIPARYAVGYSIQESAGRNQLVVRERHAHAWCLYYDQATRLWHDLDTTPGSWFAAGEQGARFWEPLADACSRLWFEFQRLRWGRSNFRSYVLAALAAALAGMVLRFCWRKQWRRRPSRPLPPQPGGTARPGLDSEFYLVEKNLVARGLERRPGETLSAWLKRIEPAAPKAVPSATAILRLHYQYRFDPAGIAAPEREQLSSRARAWLTAPR